MQPQRLEKTDLSAKEFALTVNVHPFTAIRWARTGRLAGAYQTLGGHWRFTELSLFTIREGRFNTRPRV